MNILLCSVPFHPSVGGIETVSALLAEQFHRLGHRVVVVTQTPGHTAGTLPYTVVRRPALWRLWSLVQEADVVFHNNISLRLAWPLLALRRPWVVAHHTWIPRHGAGRLKRWALRRAVNTSVSHAIATDLPVASAVLPNPYRTALFRQTADVPRDRDVVFVGRLVSDKGAQVLIDALHLMSTRGTPLTATLIGDGPERPALEAQVRRLGLGERTVFAGQQTGQALVQALNRHRCLVVPSLWEEPFGLVVLEGLACGCVPVVADSGGLAEAAGRCGRVFAKGDPHALADTLQDLLADPAARAQLQQPAAEHLARHRPERVAARYLQVMQRACGHPLAA